MITVKKNKRNNTYLIHNGIVGIGKNLSGEYRIEIRYKDLFDICIYSSRRKLVIRNIEAIKYFAFLLYPIVLVLVITYQFLSLYLIGAKRFVFSSSLSDDEWIFGWVNIVTIIILLIILITR